MTGWNCRFADFAGRGHRCFARDVGLAAMPPSAGESEPACGVPEQTQAPYAADPGIDSCQLAAVV